MISPINNIARSASKQKSLNILSFIYDGYFDTLLCETFPQHNFYAPISDNNKPTGWNFKLCPQLPNMHYIPTISTTNIISKIDFDLIICHDRTSQYDMARHFANTLHINIIIVEHIANTKSIDLIGMIPLLKKTKNDTNVFMENIIEQFKLSGTVIRYGIPNLYCQKKKNQILLLNIDQQTIDTITPHINTPIVSHDIYDLTSEQYYSLLKESKFYFNLSAETNRIQLPVLHAMSAGCIVVSMSSPVISDLINHMESGIIIENMDDLINIWNDIDTTDIVKMATSANKYIMDNYDPKIFKQKWQDTLVKIANKTYII